jgi:hypothetical protein
MSKTIRIFDYDVLLGERSHASPIIVIRLQKWSVDETHICISPHLMTEGEIDHHIDALQNDLEHVRERAKQALRAGMTLDGTRN